MKFDKRAIAALAVAAILVSTAVGGVALAAKPTVNTAETANTPNSDSELTDGSTITYNASTNSTLQFDADSPNASVEIEQASDNYTLSTYVNGTDNEFTTLNSTSNTTNFTLADDETGYSGIEADAGENATLAYLLKNDSTRSNPDVRNVTIYWQNDANKSFIRGESNETETAEPTFLASTLSMVPFVGSNSDNVTDPAKVEQSIGVNGDSQETITVYVEDSSAQDALTETYDSADSAGAVTYNGWVTVEGTFVPVLASASDAPGWLSTDNETYATVSSDGNKVVIQNAGNVISSGTTTATVQVVGNEQMGPFEIRSMLSSYDAGLVTQLTTANPFNADYTGIVGDQFSPAEA